MIKRCPKCADRPHEQDNIHQPGMRVFNEHKSKTALVLRCTRCGHEESYSISPTKEK